MTNFDFRKGLVSPSKIAELLVHSAKPEATFNTETWSQRAGHWLYVLREDKFPEAVFETLGVYQELKLYSVSTAVRYWLLVGIIRKHGRPDTFHEIHGFENPTAVKLILSDAEKLSLWRLFKDSDHSVAIAVTGAIGVTYLFAILHQLLFTQISSWDPVILLFFVIILFCSITMQARQKIESLKGEVAKLRI